MLIRWWAELHDRMPVIIGAEDRQRWLDPEQSPNDLLKQYPTELMQMWPVSTKVNSPKNEGRELIEPITLDIDGLRKVRDIPRANEAGDQPGDSE
jgi:putative SOS response-associated peptidase YedK